MKIRRSFFSHALYTSLVLLGVCVLGYGVPSGYADDAQSQETWFLLSDTHIAEDPTEIARNVNTTDHLKQVIKEVLEIHTKDKGQGILVDGDMILTKGTLGEYKSYVGLTQPFRDAGIPMYMIMGNHDTRTTFWEVLGDLAPNRGLVPDRHVGFITGPVANWIFLDSLVESNRSIGTLGEDQLEWLDRTLTSLPDKPTIVTEHHNLVLREPAPGKKRAGLTDTPEFYAVLDKHPKVKVIIHGHTHRWIVTPGENGARHIINLPSVAYPSSSGMEKATGWVLAHIDSKGMTVEMKALDKSHPENGQSYRLDW